MTKRKPQSVDRSIHISNCQIDGGEGERMAALKSLADAARQNGVAIETIAKAFNEPRGALISIGQSKD